MKLYFNRLEKNIIDKLRKELTNTTKELVNYEMLYSDEGIFEAKNKKIYRWIIEEDGPVSDINMDKITMVLDETIVNKTATNRVPYNYSSLMINEEVYKINDKMQMKILGDCVVYFESDHKDMFTKKMLIMEASKYLHIMC